MNKRILSVDVNINGLRVVKYQDATQYDKNTHFIGISFMDNVDLVGYALQVYYLPPSPSTAKRAPSSLTTRAWWYGTS